jgi:hypothetical protein
VWLLVCNPPEDSRTRVYWNAQEGDWGGFDQATRFETTTAALPQPMWPWLQATWMEDWPVDLDKFPYSTGERPWRLTHCCGAPTFRDDGRLQCESCYANVPQDYDAPPRLDANWQLSPGVKRLTVLVVDRFGRLEASVHTSPEQALARLHGLVISDWNLEGPVPEDPKEAIGEYFAGLGHYADYALVSVDLGTG